MKADPLSKPTALDGDVYAASPGTDHQDDLPCELFWFSKIDRVHDLTTLSIPQPFVCDSTGHPRREAGIVTAPDRDCQVIETSRNPRTASQIMCRSLIEADNFFSGPVCRN